MECDLKQVARRTKRHSGAVSRDIKLLPRGRWLSRVNRPSASCGAQCPNLSQNSP